MIQEMTFEKMEEIIKNEIPFSLLEKNKGIVEFYEDENISIGLSFEDLDEEQKDVYIFNLFYGDEYINICGEYKLVNGKFIDLCTNLIEELVETWNTLI